MKKLLSNLSVLVFLLIVFSETKAQTIVNEWEGHNGPANAILFSKDGLQLITGGDDGTIRIFNVSDNSLQKVIQSKNSSVKRIVLSEDGSKFAAYGDKCFIEIYAYPSCAVVSTVADTCRSLCFGSDGNKIYTCDDYFKIWDLSTGINTKSILIPLSNCVITTKDVSEVLLAGDDSKIYLFNFNANQITRKYDEHINAVLSLSLSPDGSRFASSSADRTIRIWDINNTTSLKMGFGHLGYVYSIMYSSDATKVVTSCEDGSVRLYSVDPIDVLHTYKGYTGGVYAAAFSPSVDKIASVGKDGLIKLWSAKSDSYSLLESISSHTGIINNMEYSSDGYSLITSGIDNTICLWDPALGFQLKKISGHTDTITALHFFKDANKALSASMDGYVKLWDISSGKSAMTIQNQYPVYAAACNSDYSKIFFADSMGSISINDATGKNLNVIFGNHSPIRALTYSAVGNILVSGNNLGEVNIYNADDYSLKKNIKINDRTVTGLAVSEDAAHLYIVLAKMRVYIINLSTWETETSFGFSNNISDIKEAGGKIAVVSADGAIFMLSQNKLTNHAVYEYNNGYPSKAAFSPDGSLMAIGGIGINNIKVFEPSSILSAEKTISVPDKFTLYQNYPNPFNPSTNIRFALNIKSNVTFEVYNVLGELVHKRILDNLEAGEHNISWNPASIAGGVYFYVLNNGNIRLSGKMMYLK